MNDLVKQENQMAISQENGTAQTSRALAEVQGAIVLANKFPRDTFKAMERIQEACKRSRLAHAATYTYPRGGQTVTGPSIRLAEVIAQNYGNLDFGFRVTESDPEKSKVEAYCWDYETNVKKKMEFEVPHYRYTRNGTTKLKDPRDIYELIANQASRRVRNCILAIIPQDITEEAIEACAATIAGKNGKSIEDSIRKLMKDFKEVGVSKDLLEKRLDHAVGEMDKEEFVEYLGILNSLKDGASKRSDWFDFKDPNLNSDNSNKLNSINKGEKNA